MKVFLVLAVLGLNSTALALQVSNWSGMTGDNQNISTCCPVCKDLQSQFCRSNESAMKSAKEMYSPAAPKGPTVPTATGVTI